MIPWLFPLAIAVLAIAFAVGPAWVGAIVAAVVLILAGLGWRTYVLDGDQPERRLPHWMSGWRPPRG
jgi:hypothetical protein